MTTLSAPLLVLTVAAVGVLHTAVPDHWVPILLLARQHGWSRRETASTAFRAGIGHVTTTLLLGLALWLLGTAFARRFGHALDVAAGAALVLFGLAMALGAWWRAGGRAHRHGRPFGHTHGVHGRGHRHGHTHGGHGHSHGHDGHEHGHRHPHDEARDGGAGRAVPLAFGAAGRPPPHPHPHAHPADDGALAVLVRHAHLHVHRDAGRPRTHVHWHAHGAADAHPDDRVDPAAPPTHTHDHRAGGRGALLLILGSSPMVEGLPAFLAAGRSGAGLVLVMAAVFASTTVLTYVGLSVGSLARVERLRLGALERHGDWIAGVLIASLGLVFLAV